MIVGLLLSAIPVFLVIFAIRKFATRSSSSQGTSSLKSFFQYAVLFALLLVVANGLTGLLGRVINPDAVLVADKNSLARNLSFVVVGVPLFLGVGSWTRKSFKSDPHAPSDPLATFFVTLASVAALLTALTNWVSTIQGVASHQNLQGQSLANAIIWTLIWYGLWRLQETEIPRSNLRIHHLVGSLVGYIGSVIGLVGIIGFAIAQLAGWNSANLVSSGSTRLSDSLVILVFAGIVWFQYWIRTASKLTTDNLWLGYVLIAGVAGGLVMSVAAASTSIYTTAVWFLGEPKATTGAAHFSGTPTAIGLVITGVLAWWYHSSLLPKSAARTEINRIYSYLISGIGLVASAVGLSMVLIALIEVAFPNNVLVGSSVVNSFLAAGTLIIVGGPVWIKSWRAIQHEVKQSPQLELASPTRRIYLFLLFGIGGIAAIISLLVGVYQLFSDLIASAIGGSTVYDMRYSLGVLVSTAIISGYHWEIYRHERETEISFAGRHVSVLLVGPHDKQIVDAIKTETGAHVTSWTRTDSTDLVWPTERVIEAINETQSDQLLLLLESTGLKVIPVEHK